MSYKELLEGVEVEWKALGDESLGKFIRGGGLQKKDFTESGVGCIHYGQIYTYYDTYTSKTKSFVSEEFAKKARMAKHGDLVIATTSETDEDLCKAVAWLGDKEIAVSSDACFYRHNLNPKYIAYFFQTEQFHKQKRRFITGTKVRRVNANNLAKIKIPIPCPDNPEKSLKIQKEIVRILDTFTEFTSELTTELTTELNARIKQYSFYEEKLLFENDFKRVTINKICNVNQGLQIPISKRKNEKGENRYFYITVQFLKGNNQSYYIENPPQNSICDYDDILVTRTGSTGKIITGVHGCFHNNFFKINLVEGVNKRYVFYYLKSNRTYLKILQIASGGTVPDLPHNKFYKLEIPIPPLEEQERIVSILDKFDTLTTSISEGLPKEIALRKKQYEYYRDLLLTFPKENITR